MIDEKNKLYLDIIAQSDNEIEIVTEFKNLILNNDCSNSIKIEYRKKVFGIFFTNKEKIKNDNDILLIETALVNCSVENKKLDINLIKLGQKFYEEKKDYKNSLKWLNFYDYDILNKEKFGNNRFSDYDLYFLKKSKCLLFLNKHSELQELLLLYLEKDNCDKDVVFFLKYHICKSLFYNKEFEDANKIFQELLLSKREQYLLILPIKYIDKENIKADYFLILELLLKYNMRLEVYVYDSIVNFIKIINSELYSNLIKYVEFKDGKICTCQKKQFNDLLYNYLITQDIIDDEVFEGKIDKITKSSNGFIKCEKFPKNVFVSKEFLNDKKLYDLIKFFVINTKDDKGQNSTSAIVLKEV